MKRIIIGIFLLATLVSGIGCANVTHVTHKIEEEYGQSPYKLVALGKGQYIDGEIKGGGFLFAIETDSGIHMFNVPVEKVNIILVDESPYTLDFSVFEHPMTGYTLGGEFNAAEIKGNTATYLVKKHAKEYYIRISEKDFSDFVKFTGN